MKQHPRLAACVVAVCAAVLGTVAPAQAAVITFDAVIAGAASFAADGDGDLIDDAVFSTTDPAGLSTAAISTIASIEGFGLEGSSMFSPDLRIDFPHGAVGPLTFGFAVNSSLASPSFIGMTLAYLGFYELAETADILIANRIMKKVRESAAPPSEAGAGGEISSPSAAWDSFTEVFVTVDFPGVADYALLDVVAGDGRYVIDTLTGTFGSTEDIPAPATLLLLLAGLVGMLLNRARASWRVALGAHA